MLKTLTVWQASALNIRSERVEGVEVENLMDVNRLSLPGSLFQVIGDNVGLLDKHFAGVLEEWWEKKQRGQQVFVDPEIIGEGSADGLRF